MPKLPKGPKPQRVNPALVMEAAQEQRLAERIAILVLARLRDEVPQLFTPVATPSA